MPAPVDRKVKMEGVKILFRNFAGKEGQYNREGDRNFAVLLDDHVARMMLDDGWNVKFLKAREEGDIPQAYLSVSVSYKGRPPRVNLITSAGRTPLGEDMVEFLDWVEIADVDLIINPYEWAVNGKTGIKAYLHAIYVVVAEDELEEKYRDVPEVGYTKPLELESNDDSARLDYDFEGEVVEG